MNCLHNYCSLASFVLKTVSNHSQKSYISIRLEDTSLGKKVKGLGIYAEKAVFTVAFAVAFLAIPLFILVEAGVNLFEKMGLKVVQLYDKDFHFGFESRVYGAYFQQLQGFIRNQADRDGRLLLPFVENDPGTALKQQTQNLIRFVLECPPLENEDKKREFHHAFLARLRPLVALKQEHPQEISARFVDELCEWLYNGPRIMNEMISFIEEELTAGELDGILDAPLPEISTYLLKAHDSFSNKAKFNGIRETARLYDPHDLGDIPSLLYHYKLDRIDQREIQKVKILRTPAVTRDVERDSKGNLIQADIVEEFIGLLDSYQKQGKVHVYFNLMQRTGSEGVRSKKIEQLEQRYPAIFHVISLTKDSNFYWQKGAFSHLNSASAFKNEFMAEMFERGENYHWSPALGDSWKAECKEMLDSIHTRFFQEKEQLSHQERLDFIERAYDEIKKSVLNKIAPYSANDSCKSCVDRGAADLAEQFMVHQYSNNSALSPSKRKKLMAIALAPALLAMNRSMQSQRMKRLCSFTKHYFAQN